MKKKSTVMIPVCKGTGDVPHWCYNQWECEQKLAEFRSMLEAGFQNPKYPDGRPQFENEEAWRKWVLMIIANYDYEWREPWEFADTMRIDSYGRGRSAAYFMLKSITTGARYCMFMTDMSDLLQNAEISKGVVSGRWLTCKRGQNFGIKCVFDNPGDTKDKEDDRWPMMGHS